MRSFIRFSFFTIAVVLCLPFSQTLAQRPDFNRARTYDVESYLLRVNFDRPAKKVLGETTISFKPLKDGLASLNFDAVGIKFTSVTLEPSGTSLKYATDSNGIRVTLDRGYKSTETVTMKFVHSSTPKKGVYFIPEEKDGEKVIHSAQIYTQGEPDEARYWFPSFDFPSDKATVEQFITALDGETVVGNGTLVATTNNPDGTITHHFKADFPTPVYLISFVIGKYVKISEKYKDVPLGYYTYPGMESIVPTAYGNTKEMMRVFEELTGVPYPFPKYDQTIVAQFPFGGMENMTATTMSDRDIFAANIEIMKPAVHDVVSHELAHSWFGNLVTCRNWAELWLNEGFATFMEAAFREKMFGRRNYMLKMESDAMEFLADEVTNDKRNGLFNLNAGNVATLFDRPATTYDKGGVVLHMLREEIGDDAFWRGVNLYLTRNRYGNVESKDLKAIMEETSGKNLDWFFAQWVYMAGHPKLNVTNVWNESSKTLRMTVTQVQKADKITPAVFRIPVKVEFTSGGEKKTEDLAIAKRTEVFAFKLPAKPTHIRIDPDEKVPLKTVKLNELK
ncbi:MAG TPA: M1 family metallopeptidase [Pyrinomonadaceae bacterium]|nr:M1 family metallopeptidase [Pyrinomonadaceae bacterium]